MRSGGWAPPRWLSTRAVLLAALAILAGSARPASGATPNGAASSAAATRVVRPNIADVTYHGGPVQHSSAVYAIFWAPAPFSFPANYQAVVSQYFTDVAHDSYLATNVYANPTQYYDTNGNARRYASYNVAFKAAIIETRAFPASGCTNYVIGDSSVSKVCLTDTQIQKEIASVISSHHLPRGLSTNYFLFTPQGVASCKTANGLSSGGCYNPLQFNGHCAYHSHIGSGGNAVLYAHMAYDALAGCTSLQSPNGNAADAVLNNVSHEHNEMITDPLGTGWYDSSNGDEISDKCHQTFGVPMGATATGQYNQIINGHGYYLQQGWSNRAGACVQRNSFPQPIVSFTFKPATPVHGKKITFVSSVKESGESSFAYRWSFPDNGASSAKNPTHTFASAVFAGNVTLVITDSHGSQTRMVKAITVM